MMKTYNPKDMRGDVREVVEESVDQSHHVLEGEEPPRWEGDVARVRQDRRRYAGQVSQDHAVVRDGLHQQRCIFDESVAQRNLNAYNVNQDGSRFESYVTQQGMNTDGLRQEDALFKGRVDQKDLKSDSVWQKGAVFRKGLDMSGASLEYVLQEDATFLGGIGTALDMSDAHIGGRNRLDMEKALITGKWDISGAYITDIEERWPRGPLGMRLNSGTSIVRTPHVIGRIEYDETTAIDKRSGSGPGGGIRDWHLGVAIANTEGLNDAVEKCGEDAAGYVSHNRPLVRTRFTEPEESDEPQTVNAYI